VDPGLDASWALCISWFFTHGVQYGNDLVFTFGPLGFVMYPFYCGSGLWLEVALIVAVSGAFAWVLIESIRPFRWFGRIIAVLAVLLLINHEVDVLYLLMIALIGLLLIRDENPAAGKTIVYSLILGFLSITKFTNFVMAAAAVTIAAGCYIGNRKWRCAIVIGAGFLAAFLLCWVACGQSPVGVGPYILNSLEVSKGFEDAMCVYERPWERFMGFTTAGLIVGYAGFEVSVAKQRGKTVAMALIFLAATYLSWKHSFIRADRGHISGFYYWALTPLVLNPAFFPAGRRWGYVKGAFLVAIAFCIVTGMRRLAPNEFGNCIPALTNNVRQNLGALSNPAAFKAGLDGRYLAVSGSNATPRIDKVVGRDTVDALGFEQGVVIYNGFNYTPRPVFQSYFAYTPKLAELNAAFMAGDHAPEWILQRYECIDHRYPSTDDGPALRVLLDRYTYQFADSGYLVWRLAGDKSGVPVALPAPAREGDGMINREIPVGDIANNTGLWLEVDYSYNLAGSLRKTIYKPPMVSLIVTTEDRPDEHKKFRYPHLLASGGMLLSPYLDGQYDFLKYAVGLGGPKVVSFKVECDRENAKYLKRTYHYRLMILPAPRNLSVNGTMAGRIEEYPMFEVKPSRVEGASVPASVRMDGREVLEVRAPGEIELAVPAGARRLQGGFGLKAESSGYGAPISGEGAMAEFEVVLKEGTSERVLMERELDPRRVEGDRGLQVLDVPLPPVAAGATLILRTVSKTSKEGGGDATCWTGLRVLGG
jgi:hypothetical protein